MTPLISDEQLAEVRLQMLLLYPEVKEQKEGGDMNLAYWLLPNKFCLYVDRKNCTFSDKQAIDGKYEQSHYRLTPTEVIEKLVWCMHGDN